ncbi:MAG: hypothetical protein ACRD6X_03275 [Pyrinomonadaceae bacterium]
MKKFAQLILVLTALFVFSSEPVNAQKQQQQKSKKAVVLEVTGKVAAEAGKAAIKLGAIGLKATAEQIVVPSARIVWDPILTKAAPKVVGGGAKLAEKV